MIVPKPLNEKILYYRKGSRERELLVSELNRIRNEFVDIPAFIGTKEIRTGKISNIIEPHNHSHKIGQFHTVDRKEIEQAMKVVQNAWIEWSSFPYQHRAAIFLRAAELLSVKYRHQFNAIVMLSLSKNVHQAEIDTAELIDFWRFNPYYAEQIWRKHTLISPQGEWNYLDPRPLEGFIFAITPFNFASIAGNLPTAPAILGNTVIWKPASNAVYPAYFIMKILKEAGLPDGVINMIPGSGNEVGDIVLESPSLSGIHFTGSTKVFNHIWKTIGSNIDKYRTYPRIVGETGGKDFIFVHKSANIDSLITAVVRGAFEYQGQKCSAASRMYIPESVWEEFKEKLITTLDSVKTGTPLDFHNFHNAVIDKKSFQKIVSYIEDVKQSKVTEIIFGGNFDDKKGYFIEPTVVRTTDPNYITMREEIFGPLLTIFVYPDDEYKKTLYLCESTSEYGLTGSIFSNDQQSIILAEKILRHSAGNFYINDKPTGAVVGQQPFGGSRKSGTNDKAGSIANLLRWISMRSVKVNYLPPIDYKYPFME
ncbi:MAG: L-glutamate gamma-semialdehyde dehydrogenase [Candidatus Cloacimonetes bacterium]|nr:L-glutamate gamma-semialdehyde dehydrogenase [Candidatus Cloacimonadota bacterium]